MKQNKRTYIAIDLKSFYASVECHERGLDPLKANLVVADQSRTSKTICLAVSPALKAFGIPGRARLFEVESKVKKINIENPGLNLTFITAVPRMQLYLDYSTDVYKIYLKYIAPEDIHVYSVDEVFMDVTAYLRTYNMTARELAVTIIHDVLKTTGITATAGIADNLYLCKAAMDIVAKHIPADSDGVCIAELDELSYRKILWNHRPLTDFWRIGMGTANKLEENGMYTMGDVARCALQNEDILFKMFGKNAEYLIDHAFGRETAVIKDIKDYKPKDRSIGEGQVLHCPYDFEKSSVIIREMAYDIAEKLLEKHLVTDQIVINVGYDISNLTDSEVRHKYHGQITKDWYGREVPQVSHGSIRIDVPTSSSRKIADASSELFDKIANHDLLIRRVYITAGHVYSEKDVKEEFEQLELFTDYDMINNKKKAENDRIQKERKIEEASIDIKKRFGKNAIVRGTDFRDGATSLDRNLQIGGHKA